VSVSYNQSLLHPQERVLSTLESDGSRRWLSPRLARGRFLTRRRIVAYLLIIIFTAIPYIRVNGKPAMLIDLAHRKFSFFGLTFLPTDTVLLALFMVSVVLSIFFVTALFGRVWCGWACPQTVYMEFVYRPIERLFTGKVGRGGAAKNVPGWRTAAMYFTFLLASMYLAHTFLAYFVGVDALRYWIRQSPFDHPAAFLIMLVTTGLMMFDFAFFREQTCIIACPYGRLQSVLMDKQSLIITYDAKRGEPRGKAGSRPRAAGSEDASAKLPAARLSSPKSASSPLPASPGDCIACEMCVSVCPTGIDIRDGLQIECIGCAQCIDACDHVMDRIGSPRGLIRYSSQSAMSGEPRKILRPRVAIYMGIVITLLSLLGVMVFTKSQVDVTLLRSLGRPYVMTDAGEVENTLRVKLTNRTEKPLNLQFAVVGNPQLRLITQSQVQLKPSEVWTEPMILVAPTSAFTMGNLTARIRVTCEDGVLIDRECLLLGPVGHLASTGGAGAQH
jgi:cytochrome c oxidase accessory protein FixG